MGDKEWIKQQEVAVGIPDLTRIALSAEENPTHGEFSEGFAPNNNSWNTVLH